MSAFELNLIFVAAPLITIVTFGALYFATKDLNEMQNRGLVKARIKPTSARPRRR